MKASVILTAAGRQLQDEGATRWTAAKLLAYLNHGRREVVKRRPQEFRVFRSVQLVAGAKQTVPDDCAGFIGLTRNMGSDGGTPGGVIREVDRATLDAIAPLWMADSGSVVKEVMPPAPRGKEYLVNPPVASGATVYVEMELAAYPADLTQTDGSEDLGMADTYETPLLNWVLYMAFGEETEEGAPTKAADHFKLFLEGLGVTE